MLHSVIIIAYENFVIHQKIYLFYFKYRCIIFVKK